MVALVIGLGGACVGSDAGLAPVGEAGGDGAPVESERLPRAPGMPSPLQEEDDDEGAPGDQLFAATVHAMGLEIDASNLASLRADPYSEVPATLEWRGHSYEVAVRLKGNTSFRPIDEKPSFRVDVHAFDPELELDGLERLTLNNLIQDPTMLREHAAYAFFAKNGLPGPRQGYVRMTLNGADYGLYSLVETMDEQLLKRALPDDRGGNLYEASGADFTYARNWYDVEETSGLWPDGEDIDALVRAVEEAPYGTLDTVIREHFDRDAFLRYLAVDIVSGHADGYVFNHNNYLAYHGGESGRWRLLPWGSDQVFRREVGAHGDERTPVEGVLAAGCWADPACAADLEAEIEAVSWGLDAEFIAAIEATRERIREHAEADTRAEYAWDPEELLDFVEARGAYVRDTL